MIFCYFCGNQIIVISKNQKESFNCTQCKTLEIFRSPDNEKRSYLKAVFTSLKDSTLDQKIFIQNEIERQKKLSENHKNVQIARREGSELRREERRQESERLREEQKQESERLREEQKQESERLIEEQRQESKRLREVEEKLSETYTKIYDHITSKNEDLKLLDELKKDYILFRLKLTKNPQKLYPDIRTICNGFENNILPRSLITFYKEHNDQNHIAKNIGCRRYYVTDDPRHDEFCQTILDNKYENETASSTLSNLMYEKIKEVMPEYKDENFLIVPVPNRLSKLPSCGVSIAMKLSKYLEKPCLLDALAKIKSTDGRKSGIGDQARAFMAEQSYEISNVLPIKNKKILLVDDVCWGGSTMNKCARLLIENGARHVMCFSAGMRDNK